MIVYKNVSILDINHYVPERIVSNAELIEKGNLKIKASWIEKRIGIRERRWARDFEAASDLAVHAIRKMKFKENSGPLFVSTISPDFLSPSTSSIIKRKLSWNDTYPSIDINAACAGFLFSLEQAASLIELGASSEATVIATEVRSKWLNLNDRRTVFLFGDAACALRLVKTKTSGAGEMAKVLWTETFTLASREPEIFIPAGGSVCPLTIKSLENYDHCIRMVDGEAIVEATQNQLVSAVKNTLQLRNETPQDYAWILFHQGNGNIILLVCKALDFSIEKTWINFDRYGNSSSASIGVVLSELFQSGKVKHKDKILLVAMGAGSHLGLVGLEVF